MIRLIIVASALFALMPALGCGNSSESPPNETMGPGKTAEETGAPVVNPGERPENVPIAATPVVQTTSLGEITRRAEETPQVEGLRTLAGAECEGDVLVLETPPEVIFATLTCDKFSNEQFADLFVGKQAAVVLEIGPERQRILIETIDGAQAEFTPDAIWIQ